MKPFTKVFVIITGITIAVMWSSCSKIDRESPDNKKIDKSITLVFSTLAVEQDEVITRETYLNFVNDINLFVFDENGNLSQHQFIQNPSQSPVFVTTLKKATLFAVANWGSSLYNNSINYLSAMNNLYIEYNNIADLSSRNIYTGKSELINIYDGININIEMVSSFAKLTVCFDKSELSPGVNVSVNPIERKNSPNATSLFNNFFAINTTQIMSTGDKIVSPVMYTQHTLAQPMLLAENMQGTLLPYNNNQSNKVLSEPLASLCSYVEIVADYNSPGKTGTVKYRIYLGRDETKNFDIKRNTWYKLTVKFKGNTLNETSWRLVTDDLKDLVTDIQITPGSLDFDSLSDTKQLTASIFPESADNKTISWSSTNPLIASVTSNGTVTSNGYGNCRIIARANDVSGVSDTVMVNVVYNNPVKQITDIILSPSNMVFTYLITPSQTITATVYPVDASNKSLYWESSNNQVATVSQSGIVSQTGPGNCIISATSLDGSNIRSNINVSVNYAVATGIEIVEDYNQETGITIPAKNRLVDARFCDGIRSVNNYKVKVAPFNANQNVIVNWSLSTIQNNPSQMATLTKLSNESANIAAKDIINVLTNRGSLILIASSNGLSDNIVITIFEKIPLRLEWGTWVVPDSENEVEGIVPRYAYHNSMVAPILLPEIAIIGNSDTEYWGAQLGILWINPNLPTTYYDFLNEFSQSFVHPGSEYNVSNNCFYTIEH